MTTETLTAVTSHKLAGGRHLAPRQVLVTAGDIAYVVLASAADVPCRSTFQPRIFNINLSIFRIYNVKNT